MISWQTSVFYVPITLKLINLGCISFQCFFNYLFYLSLFILQFAVSNLPTRLLAFRGTMQLLVNNQPSSTSMTFKMLSSVYLVVSTYIWVISIHSSWHWFTTRWRLRMLEHVLLLYPLIYSCDSTLSSKSVCFMFSHFLTFLDFTSSNGRSLCMKSWFYKWH